MGSVGKKKPLSRSSAKAEIVVFRRRISALHLKNLSHSFLTIEWRFFVLQIHLLRVPFHEQRVINDSMCRKLLFMNRIAFDR